MIQKYQKRSKSLKKIEKDKKRSEMIKKDQKDQEIVKKSKKAFGQNFVTLMTCSFSIGQIMNTNYCA